MRTPAVPRIVAGSGSSRGEARPASGVGLPAGPPVGTPSVLWPAPCDGGNGIEHQGARPSARAQSSSPGRLRPLARSSVASGGGAGCQLPSRWPGSEDGEGWADRQRAAGHPEPTPHAPHPAFWTPAGDGVSVPPCPVTEGPWGRGGGTPQATAPLTVCPLCLPPTLQATGPSGAKMQLLETAFSRTVPELIELHLLRQDSIPAFLSALTLDLFSRQTVA